jgi:endonuclease YncB( thermonuclease family)
LFEVNSRSCVGGGQVTQNFCVSPSGDAEIEIEGDARSDSIDLQGTVAQNLPVRLLHSPSIIVMLFASTVAALPDDLAGQASVIDGDTLEIHGMRIRLWGIDAPETSQLCRSGDSLQYRCGAKAANDLDAFIARRPVGCIPIALDRYGRTVASCSVGGVDLGEWLVSNGLALDWPQYSRGRYGDVQSNAEQAGRGLWAGSHVEPWLYRVCIRAGGSPENCSDDANAHP